MIYSPLRYPGGKGKLAPFMKYMLEKTKHKGGTYIEPFAGGAGIALDLLINNIVNQIVINDLDKGIYSFWRAVLTDTDRFIERINDVSLNMEVWHEQRDVVLTSHNRYSFDLGFAVFFLNRTNVSGIINGGVIGGLKQNGNWKLDARFNKQELIKRIINIADRKSQIRVYNKDVSSFISRYLPKYKNNSLVYFDPPYFSKGKQLYLNFFGNDEHIHIEKMIREEVDCDWIITYDDVPEIADIYKDYNLRRFDLNYSAATKRKASEIMIFKDEKMIPEIQELIERKIFINLR